ncbi:MAG: ribosome recycling factor [Acutalibacteraceae bacterium]|jgi:ribosome recycling factor|nr:ribosome recycling factor [Clostridia bacterium]MDO4406041.1 ribosome recycling factor [Eubacteriales bacterium]MEE1188796.1 ribosome recycling factor [Acutalibacteraceae bacterium]MBQ1596252.1 ribosome recycling factor [Clostridia bacterium]MBQ2015694.1 ribosome recycling factor [Clostridia bacterium]
MAEQKTAESRMQKAVDRLVTDYSEIRAGRANPNVLDKVMVDYYGTPTPINQVGSVSVAEARILVIQPWDKGLLNPIMKAIQASDIGINPQNDGSVIRLTFPQLTEERRKELAKGISKRGEEAKVAVRNIRRDEMDALKKAKKANELTEDDLRDEEEKLQKLTDKVCKEIDEIAANKTKEIMSV